MTSEYAARVKRRLTGTANRFGRPISIREASQRLGYSYEHVRQALLGRPVGSRKFSDALSQLCGLDSEEMWRLALREKAARRYGANVLRTLDPPADRRMGALWQKLTDGERNQVIAVTEGLLARRASRPRS